MKQVITCTAVLLLVSMVYGQGSSKGFSVDTSYTIEQANDTLQYYVPNYRCQPFESNVELVDISSPFHGWKRCKMYRPRHTGCSGYCHRGGAGYYISNTGQFSYFSSGTCCRGTRSTWKNVWFKCYGPLGSGRYGYRWFRPGLSNNARYAILTGCTCMPCRGKWTRNKVFTGTCTKGVDFDTVNDDSPMPVTSSKDASDWTTGCQSDSTIDDKSGCSNAMEDVEYNETESGPV